MGTESQRARRLVVVALIGAASLAGRGQAPSPSASATQGAPPPAEQAAQPPVFRGGANLARVDVAVIDRRGNPMTNLTADDFDVEEDGLPQTIQAFQFVSVNGEPGPADEESLPIRSVTHAAAEAARDDVRVFLIFWDEYHINRFASAIRGREALRRFVTTAFAPKDLVALMDPLTPTSAIRFTRDRTLLADRIQKLEGRRGVYLPPRSDAERAQLEYGDVERLRAEVTVSALKSAALYLGSLREGRKSIVFVSETVGALGHDGLSQLQDAIRAANDSNTAIYTIDPRGLLLRASDSLWMLAENTGGRAVLNTNSLADGLRQVVTDASAFYLLGYTSTQNPSDGRFHQIRVCVKRPGTEVRARRGYWAPRGADVERAREIAAAAELSPEIAGALAGLPPTQGRRVVDVWTGTARGDDGRSRVTLTWDPRISRGGRRADVATVSIVAKGPGGKPYHDGPIDRQGIGFAADPGTLDVLMIARDPQGNILEEESYRTSVPDFTNGLLALSTPVVLRLRTALDVRAVDAGGPSVPFAGREVSRADRLLVRFALYGNAAATAAVSAQLLNRRGTSLVSLPISRVDRDRAAYQIDLPLGAIAQGEFLISIEATEGDERAKALVPLRIVG
jgi:VWFA-related protein